MPVTYIMACQSLRTRLAIAYVSARFTICVVPGQRMRRAHSHLMNSGEPTAQRR